MRAPRWTLTFAAALVAAFAFAPIASAAGTSAQLTAPENFRVVSNTAEAITLAWNPVSGNGVYYELYQDDQTYPSWIPTATWEIKRNDASGLTPGSTHTFRVRAGDQDGDFSEFSSTTVTWADGDVTPPTAPTNLRIVSETASGWTVAWDPSNDDSGKVFYTIVVTGPGGSIGYDVGALTRGSVPRDDGIVGPTQSAFVVANDATRQNVSERSNVLTFTP